MEETKTKVAVEATEKNPRDTMKDLILSLQNNGCEISVSRKKTEFTLSINTPISLSTKVMSFDINNEDGIKETISTLALMITEVNEGLKQKEAVYQWEEIFNSLNILKK